MRFDWRDPFVALSGVSCSADILDARCRLHPDKGDAQPVELRRVLQPWSDSPTGNDWNGAATGAPTRRDHAHPSGRWNQAGARTRTPGVDGDDPADYSGANDLADPPDTVAVLPSIAETFEVISPAITDAYRFWFDEPSLDFGHALLLSGSQPYWPQARFHRWEEEFQDEGPQLVLTYRVPVPPSMLPEVSPPGAAQPLRIARGPSSPSGDLDLTFEDAAVPGGLYNVAEGSIGTWYSHGQFACALTATPTASALTLRITPGPGDAYYLVTVSDPCGEGPPGADSTRAARPDALTPCGP